MFWFILLIFIFVILPGFRVLRQYKRGVVFTLGKYSGVKGPGLIFLVPFLQTMQVVDLRVKVLDVPDQEVITKDNIPVRINAVVYFRIVDPAKVVLEVESYRYAVLQLAQTMMKNIVGEKTLDELLQQRAEIANLIKKELDQMTDKWGIDITVLELKDIIIPSQLKRTISKAAEAEREKRAVIIKAEGDRIAAENIAKAAEILHRVPGALHLRTLQSINDLSSDQSNTTIWMVPLNVLEAFEGFPKKFTGFTKDTKPVVHTRPVNKPTNA